MNGIVGSLAFGREWQEAIGGWGRMNVNISNYTYSRKWLGRTN
jgi:hypothetical protein